jgi:hypothetical protein
LLTAGDNFYPKLSGVNDPLWQSVFEQMYDPQVLDFPFYAALGNHDYDDGKYLIELEYARRNPRSRWKLPARWYRLDFPAGPHHPPIVTVYVLDSDKSQMGDASWTMESEWLRYELSRPRRAAWVVCVAHHPLYSNGDHGDNRVLQREWGALFEQYHADFYICGHDHDLQHLEITGRRTSFILCGGGGAGIRPMRNDRRGPFSKSLYGFAHLTFRAELATVRLVDRERRVVHAFSRDREGNIRILDSSASDVAQPRTPRSVTRDDPGAATTTPTQTTAP